jgi:hypothetical protein
MMPEQADRLVVLDPTVAPDPPELVAAPRLVTLEGQIGGLLDNRKANADRFLAHLGAVLRDRYGVADLVVASKADASTVAAPEVLSELVRHCHFIVAGVGD